MTGRRPAGPARGPGDPRRAVGADPATAVDSGHAATAADSGHAATAADSGHAATAGADHDRGSFTAELAAGLPALMLLLLIGLTAVNAVATRAQCVDAAREAALAASRGEPGVPAGRRAAPAGAVVSVSVQDGTATATVRAPVRALGARLPRVTVTARAVAAIEPGPPEPLP